MPHAFGHNERVAAEHNRHVMMPSGVQAAFKMVEAELAFEVFVGTLGSPALFEKSNDLLFAQPPRKAGEYELAGFRLILKPLHHEPDTLALIRLLGFFPSGNHAAKAEARGHLCFRPLSPGESTKGACAQLPCKAVDTNGIAMSHTRCVQQPHTRIGVHGDCVVETKFARGRAKLRRSPVEAVGKHELPSDSVRGRSSHHVHRELDLRLEYNFGRDAGLLPSRRIFGPTFRQIQFEVDRYMLCR